MIPRSGQQRCASGKYPWRGLQEVDLARGTIAEWFRFDGAVTELFDVAVIPGICCPCELGPQGDGMAHAVVRAEASSFPSPQQPLRQRSDP
jgi:hypothetical protein